MQINAIRIEGDKQQEHPSITAEEALELIRSQDFTWVDLEISMEDSKKLRWLLVDELDFHPATLEDCLHPTAYHLPKIDEEQDYKFITFLYYLKNEKTGKLEPLELNIYVSVTFVITVHRHACPDLKAEFGSFPPHLADYKQRAILFSHHILDKVVDSFAQHLTEIQDRTVELELSVLKADKPRKFSIHLPNRHHRQLSDMRMILRIQQALVRLRRTLAAELEIIQQLIDEFDFEGASEESEEIGIYFGDVADHIKKYLEIIEGLDRTMNHLMEVHHLVTGHRTNEIIFILTILSVVLMPLNLIVGFFGMNFKNLVLINQSWGQVGVIMGMVTVTLIMIAFFRYKGWI